MYQLKEYFYSICDEMAAELAESAEGEYNPGKLLKLHYLSVLHARAKKAIEDKETAY